MVQADGQNIGRFKTLTLDVERYQAMLDAPDLSNVQKRALIETLWQVVVGFIDLDIEICTTESCGKPGPPENPVPEGSVPVVHSSIPKLNIDFGAAIFSAANKPNTQKTDKEAS